MHSAQTKWLLNAIATVELRYYYNLNRIEELNNKRQLRITLRLNDRDSVNNKQPYIYNQQTRK